jgi:hypothetical protein
MACKPSGGPSTSRSIMACRAVRAERSISPNELSGMGRGGTGLRGNRGAGWNNFTGAGRGGGATATGGGGAASNTTTGSGGAIVRGGNGCAQPRFTVGGGVRGAGVTTRRGVAERG